MIINIFKQKPNQCIVQIVYTVYIVYCEWSWMHNDILKYEHLVNNDYLLRTNWIKWGKNEIAFGIL